MTEHRIATQEEWQVERDELLKEEKELTRRGGAGAVPGGRNPAHRLADGGHVRNGRRGVRHRGTGHERVLALGRDRLPNLPQHRARPRTGDGLLRAARSHAEGPRRERHGTALAAAPRRIRDELAWLCRTRLGPKRSCAHRRRTNPHVDQVGAGWRGGYCTGFRTGVLAGRSDKRSRTPNPMSPRGRHSLPLPTGRRARRSTRTTG